jgi:23S rRNA (uridine2552-2'-O)-methyltransferase
MSRRRPDHYTDKAKKAGYEARSVYKLQSIQDKFGIISRGDSVLDIGAAPGSWTQLAAEILRDSGAITAVDLSPLSVTVEAERLTQIQGDIFDAVTQEEIARHGQFDVIISDAAPATTGNRSLDTTRSAAIVELILYLSEQWLKPGGNLAAKIFQGGEEQAILKDMRTRFGSARAFKPKATRKESFETYLIGLSKST